MKKLIILLPIFLFQESSSAQWLDPRTISATVSLEKEQNGVFMPYGTGFLLYNYRNPDLLTVVTCAHLLRYPQIFVRMNTDSSLVAFLDQNNVDSLITPDGNWFIERNTVRCSIRLTKEPQKTYVLLVRNFYC